MEWISVKDKLPENNDRVIICSMSAINDYSYPYNYLDACEMGFYENGHWYSDTRYEILEQTVHNIFKKRMTFKIYKRLNLINSEWFKLDDVTHWMPLPKAPKYEKN